MKHPRLATAMLFFGMILSYAWQWVPDDYIGLANNICSAVFALLLLVLAAMTWRSWEIRAVVGLLAVFKIMIAACDTWYIFDPWVVKPGQAMCAARLNLPLGIIGLVLGVILAGEFAARLHPGRKR